MVVDFGFGFGFGFEVGLGFDLVWFSDLSLRYSVLRQPILVLCFCLIWSNVQLIVCHQYPSTHLSCLDCCPWMTSRVAPYVATDCNSAVAPFDRTLSSLLWASSPSPLSWPSFPSPQLQIGEMSEKSLAPNSISTVSLTDLSSFEDGMHLTLSWIALGSQNL